MNKFIESTVKRFKNPAFWTGIISLILLVFSSAGLDFSTMTSWETLWQGVISILSNPVSVVAVIGAIVGISANTETKGFLDGNK